MDIQAKYTIGVAAKMLNVSVHLLRVYEREGFIIPERTDSGRRLYSDLEIEKVRCLRHVITEFGMNFEGIRRILALVPCWKLKGCDEREKEKCAAVKNIARPCWATEEKCAHLLDSCRNCIVYQATVDCERIKELLFER